jgi:hypothetical protein
MDCVGCEKCRLWGKLQVLGLGTALKILFSVDGQNQPSESVSFSMFWISFVLHINKISKFIAVLQPDNFNRDHSLNGIDKSKCYHCLIYA